MGKKSNVNPDHYKTAGRERQGEDIAQEQHRQKYAQAKAAQRKASRGKSAANLIPGAPPTAKAVKGKKKKA
jgi:hypothetical protein